VGWRRNRVPGPAPLATARSQNFTVRSPLPPPPLPRAQFMIL